METINGLYRIECIRTKVFHDRAYETLSDVEYGATGRVGWYITRRLHSTLGYLTPVEFENAHYTSRIHEGHPV